MPAEHVVHGRAATAIRHVRDFDPRLLAEHRHREMAERADADDAYFTAPASFLHAAITSPIVLYGLLALVAMT